MHATKVSERVYLLDTYAFGVAGTVGVYLIKGPKPTLIDCGYASSYENVLAGLAEVGVMPSDLKYIIPTHVHLDHAGAAGRLVRAMPNAEVIAHEKSVEHLVDPTKKLLGSVTRVFGEELVKLYGAPEAIPAERITPVGKEASLDLGGGITATIIHTPGHAPHQVSVVLDATKTLITSDAVGVVYPWLKAMIPTTPPPSFNPVEFLGSLRSLRQMAPAELLVPHFGVRKDTDWIFDTTAQKVSGWTERIRDMRRKGMDFDGIVGAMENDVKAEARVDNLEIQAGVLIRASTKGIIHYLEKSAS